MVRDQKMLHATSELTKSQEFLPADTKETLNTALPLIYCNDKLHQQHSNL